MAKLALSIALYAAMLGPAIAAETPGWKGLFNVAERAAALRTPAYSAIRNACLKIPLDSKWTKLKPIAGLSETEGYGSDNRAEDFSWAVMVLSGRALAGDETARTSLTGLLLRWADADAFARTQEVNDAYYALKRQLLPVEVAYTILEPSLAAVQAEKLRTWIDPLVRHIDKAFDGEVDHNNHRVLADSVLAVWGSVIGDKAMFEKAMARYDVVLSETRADGTLPLEARRGARALWYQRQTLSSLVVLAETARGAGLDLYGHITSDGRSIATLIGALMNGLSSPAVVQVYSAENHIPGPEKNFLKVDLGFLEKRGHGRHYMAFAEAILTGSEGLAQKRLQILFNQQIAAQRPLVDEFAGGNATCFWGRP